MTSNKIIIGSTQTVVKKLDIKDIELFDRSNGCNIINCHYLINEEGKIIKMLGHEVECGSGKQNISNNIKIRYIGGLCNKEKRDTRTRAQLFSLYALIFSLYEQGYCDVICDGTSNIDIKNDFGFDMPELFQRCRTSIEKYKEIKQEIEEAQELASDLIDKGVYKTKEEILTSKYAKIYEYGINKFNDIIRKHLSSKNELIEVSDEKIKITSIGNCSIPKTVLEYIYNICSKKGFKPIHFILTTFYENACLRFSKSGDFVYIDNKKYIHPLYLFNAWSLIKKTYPISKTTKLIEHVYDIETLTNAQLKMLLSAYILLYNEVKTIRDFDANKMWDKIYAEVLNGTYIPGQNYVIDTYQINSRNLLYYIRRNVELPKI